LGAKIEKERDKLSGQLSWKAVQKERKGTFSGVFILLLKEVFYTPF